MLLVQITKFERITMIAVPLHALDGLLLRSTRGEEQSRDHVDCCPDLQLLVFVT